MSLYNSEITTREINSVFDRESFKTEFRLNPDTVYLANIRLCNSGITSSEADTYNKLLGAIACIKSIQLYDNNTLLDQILEGSFLNSFRNVNSVNSDNISMNRYLKHHGLGYLSEGDQSYVAGVPTRDSQKVLTQNPSDNVGDKAWISLKDMLPFLKASSSLPTNVFTKLRLVINWKSATELKDLVTLRRDATISTIANTFLIADEVNNGDMKTQMMSGYQGVQYRPVEHDSVQVNAISGLADSAGNTTKTQSNNFMVNGFDNKRVRKLVIVQTPLDSTTWVDGVTNKGYSNQGSVAQYKTKYQCRVNGSNLIARDGWDGDNQRLAHLVDSWGDCNIIAGQNNVFLDDIDNNVEGGTELAGQLDYTGIIVDDTVREMIVDFERVGVFGNAKQNQALRLNIFGEVEKAVVVGSDGRYNVVYV